MEMKRRLMVKAIAALEKELVEDKKEETTMKKADVRITGYYSYEFEYETEEELDKQIEVAREELKGNGFWEDEYEVLEEGWEW